MNRVEVKELECFVAVAEQLNFSKAARQLHLSQPPLTRRIQAMEEKLGTKLFLRNTHSVSLTDAGALFLEDAVAILRHLNRAAESMGRARDGETARLRLAFVGALLDEKLVRLIQKFREAHPNLQVEVTDLAPAAQLEGIEKGEIDGGFIGARPAKTSKGVTLLAWDEEPLLLAVPEKHSLAKARRLRWHDLNKLAWVMVSRRAAPAFRQQFAEIEKKHGISARIVQESDRVPAILTMVAAGSGVTLVPESVRHLISRGVVFRSLPSPQPLLRHTFAYRAGKASGALEDFLKLLRKAATGR
jgi:DNA-binding transcriptional LysR family regulator